MSENQNSKNNSFEKSTLEYIKISHKNLIEELSSDEHIKEVYNALKNLSSVDEDVGGEINKFFQLFFQENKESDLLKLLYSISSSISKQEKDQVENCLNEIMNRPEFPYVILTKDLSEQLCIILKQILRTIKKHYPKIKNFNQLIDMVLKFSTENIQTDILMKYKTQKASNSNKNDEVNYLFNNSDKNLINASRKNNIYQSFSSGSLSKIQKVQNNNSDRKTYRENDNYEYVFKKSKEDKKYGLPVEMLILLRKFNIVKTLKLTINNNSEENLNCENDTENNNNYEEVVLEQNDLQNTIFVLFNLEWLFPNIVELEVDLSNENIMESEINLYKKSLKNFGKLLHKDIKISTYIGNSYNKKNNDPIQNSLFSQNTHINDDDISSDKFSSSMTSNTLNYSSSFNKINLNNNFIEVDSQNKEKFYKKYKPFLEMIIIYGYFIRKMNKIIKTKFILPLNLSYDISQMLKGQKILFNDFHFLTFINQKEIKITTIDFNSLDNQAFEKLLIFLNNNQLLNVCNISFFPPEQYFKTELLFKLLQNCDEKYTFTENNNNKYGFNKNLILDTKYEDLDTYILKQLTENFEKNIREFFYLLTIKGNIIELSLTFDIPTILSKNGHYNNILMKFFLDLFIFIDKSLNNIKILTINAENFVFDSKKNPILNDFFDNLSFYINKENKLTSLTFQVKFYNINNIYKLVGCNLTNLSLGSFDYFTFNNLVDYLTSGEYRLMSKLKSLKINLNYSVFEINKVYDTIIRLFTKYPKELNEIVLYTYLSITYEQLMNLLMKMNYNTLNNILIQFSKKSIIKDKKLEQKLECDLTNVGKDICIKTDNFCDLYKVKRDKKIINKLINSLMGLSRINKDIMKYNIYTNIEKFLLKKSKKNVIIQFK